MIHELRIYSVLPGRMPAMLRRFETRTLKIWDRIGIRQIGFWTTVIGPSHLELVYMLEWDSLAERDRLWNAFATDPEWLEAWAESERDGVIVGKVANTILKPTSFSALQ
ncbi:MAG: NIPSNAP family protein [Gemmobacter sp.]|nr:NIPSNAP family protein [Gemmobacter sp.]